MDVYQVVDAFFFTSYGIEVKRRTFDNGDKRSVSSLHSSGSWSKTVHMTQMSEDKTVSDMDNSMDSRSMLRASFNTDLVSFSATMLQFRSWNIIETQMEPLLIVSGQFPHIILKCSHAWSAIMRLSNERSFASYLEQHIVREDTYQRDVCNLHDMYFVAACNGYGHCLLRMCVGDGTVAPMSLHAYSIGKVIIDGHAQTRLVKKSEDIDSIR